MLIGLVVLSAALFLLAPAVVPLITPADKRGRVLAVEAVFIGASNELGAFESGVAASVLGPVPAVVLGGVLSVGAAVVWTVLFPGLWRIDRFEDVQAATAAERVER